MKLTRVIVADDQPLIRDGLAAILNMEETFEVVAKTSDGLETLEQVRLYRPELVLMDIHMTYVNGLEATRQIKSEFPEVKIIILTTFEDEEYMWEALRYGASGYLVKGTATERIISTIQDCLEERFSFPAKIQQRLMQSIKVAPEIESKVEDSSYLTIHDKRLTHLTPQEHRIVQCLLQGKSNQAISAELFLTTGTVKNYLYAIYKKLDVSSRAEAITMLLERG